MPYKDKVQQKEAQRRHYVANKVRYAASSKRNRDKRDIWFQSLKSACICSRCGTHDARCLDFHHKDPTQKQDTICNLVKQGYSEEKILTEIYKCEVLCANCHIKLHFSAKESYHRTRVAENLNWLRVYKTGLKCRDCNVDDPIVLAFHHRNKSDKRKNVGLMCHTGSSVTRLLEEIAKCDVLCANCHRIEHNGNVWTTNSRPRPG